MLKSINDRECSSISVLSHVLAPVLSHRKWLASSCLSWTPWLDSEMSAYYNYCVDINIGGDIEDYSIYGYR